jgi:hypothetical protein
MIRLSPRLDRGVRWLLIYLWSVPSVIWLADLMNWRYDGDIAWWLATIWISPVLFIGEFTGLALTALAIPFLLILALITLLFLLRNRLPPTMRLPQG